MSPSRATAVVPLSARAALEPVEPVAPLRPAPPLPRRRPLVPPATTVGSESVGVMAQGLTVTARNGATLLDGADLVVQPGELLAVAGPSGAGKSTLVAALVGRRALTAGRVTFVDASGRPVDAKVGFVPQEDLLHRDLPLRTTLRFAAALRIPGCDRAELEGRVDDALRALDLAHRADARVRDLSGGERTRASVAAELLGRPDVLLLDEPTSGLDPATAAEVVGLLRRLAESGTTVVFTTHHLPDLDRADRLVLVAPGGRMAFTGTAAAVRRATATDDLTVLYEMVADDAGLADPAGATPSCEPCNRVAFRGPAVAPRRSVPPGSGERGGRIRSFLRQWSVLTRRNLALLLGNRLTLAIVFGSPALVVTMMVVLFPAGAAADPATNPATAVQSAFWMAFAAFFFGLTAGLLQIVPEAAVMRHEQRAGVSATAYVTAKLTALAPVVLLVGTGMLVALERTGRLPGTDAASLRTAWVVVVVSATSALVIGLLTSALVCDAAQATLALPMLCFPQVLFAGAVVPVTEMALVGRFMSHAMITRWAFEGLGPSLGLSDSLPDEAAAFDTAGDAATAMAVLAALTLVGVVAVVLVVRSRTRRI